MRCPVIFLILGSLLALCMSAETPKPNVLFIAIDDLRPELNCYGKEKVVSPNIDQLAAEGSLFTRAYCNIPVCGASRASLLSGIRGGFDRFLHYYTWLEREVPDAIPLNKFYQQNGYRTAAYGKIFHHDRDHLDGWDRFDNEILSPSGWRDYVVEANIAREMASDDKGPPVERTDVRDNAYRDGRIADLAIEELETLADSDQPFFLAVGFLKPHLPFNAPEKYWALYDDVSFDIPPAGHRPENAPRAAFHHSGELRGYGDIPPTGPVSDAMAKTLIQGYYACVSYTDAQIGRVLDALKGNGLADNTIVVLWGDHGWNLRDHGLWCKHCLFNSSLQVPLIIKVPGQQPNHVPGITEFVDIYPTLCELTGLTPPPNQLDGQSLVPMMKDPTNLGDGIAVSRWFKGTTLIKGDYFYTEWRDRDDKLEARMLYDHSVDPGELNNLARDPANAELVENLSNILIRERGKDFFKPVAEVSKNK